MTDDIEWVERPLDLADAVQCTRCRAIKLRPHFYRHKTRKQLVSMGRVGAHTEDFIHVGNVCHDCLPPRTQRLETLTRAMLDSMAVYGDISRVDYEAEVRRRETSRSATGAASRQKGWRIQREKEWGALSLGVAEELRQITYQLRNVKESPALNKRAEMDFFKMYRGILTQIHSAMKMAKRLATQRPPYPEWVAYIDPQDREALAMLWQRCTIPRTIPTAVKKHFHADAIPHHALYRAEQARDRLIAVRDQFAKRSAEAQEPAPSLSFDEFLAKHGIEDEE